MVVPGSGYPDIYYCRFLYPANEELTEYYHYLKEMQNNLLNLIEATFDENFAADFSIIFPIRQNLQVTAENTAY